MVVTTSSFELFCHSVLSFPVLQGIKSSGLASLYDNLIIIIIFIILEIADIVYLESRSGMMGMFESRVHPCILQFASNPHSLPSLSILEVSGLSCISQRVSVFNLPKSKSVASTFSPPFERFIVPDAWVGKIVLVIRH